MRDVGNYGARRSPEILTKGTAAQGRGSSSLWQQRGVAHLENSRNRTSTSGGERFCSCIRLIVAAEIDINQSADSAMMSDTMKNRKSVTDTLRVSHGCELFSSALI